MTWPWLVRVGASAVRTITDSVPSLTSYDSEVAPFESFGAALSTLASRFSTTLGVPGLAWARVSADD